MHRLNPFAVPLRVQHRSDEGAERRGAPKTATRCHRVSLQIGSERRSTEAGRLVLALSNLYRKSCAGLCQASYHCCFCRGWLAGRSAE